MKITAGPMQAKSKESSCRGDEAVATGSVFLPPPYVVGYDSLRRSGSVKRRIRHVTLGTMLATLAFTFARLEAAETAAPITLRDVPLLFVDDAPIASQSGLVRTFHPARTRAEPVIQADRPWEGDRVYTYGSVFYDAESRLFRLWYMSRSQRPDGTKPAPQLRAGGQDVVVYATSTDGVRWEKPALGIHAYDGSTANNIVFDVHSPAVVLDRFERDPAKRFKLLGYSHGDYIAAHSADGIRWTAFPKASVFKGNDTMSMTQDPRTGEFLAYFKKSDPKVRGRIVWLTRSRDMQTWSEPKLVFHSDEEDNRWSTNADQNMEVYNMAVYPHAGGFFGLPTMFRVTARSPKGVKMPPSQSGNDGPIDVQMATSVDGEKWQRTWPRQIMIPRGAPGTFDGGTILGLTSNSVDSGDETWIYYTAINTGHGGAIPPKRITIGRAEWRRHGFASLDASPAGGKFETKPLLLSGGTLLINADASRGVLRAAVREADGRPIAGFSIDDFEPLKSNATRAVAHWKGGALPSDRPVRVGIEMVSTRFFSLASEQR
jgi:hypothetical protein